MWSAVRNIATFRSTNFDPWHRDEIHENRQDRFLLDGLPSATVIRLVIGYISNMPCTSSPTRLLNHFYQSVINQGHQPNSNRPKWKYFEQCVGGSPMLAKCLLTICPKVGKLFAITPTLTVDGSKEAREMRIILIQPCFLLKQRLAT